MNATSIVSSHCSLVAGVVVLWLHLPVNSGAGPVAAGSAAAGHGRWPRVPAQVVLVEVASVVFLVLASLTRFAAAARLPLVSSCSWQCASSSTLHHSEGKGIVRCLFGSTLLFEL